MSTGGVRGSFVASAEWKTFLGRLGASADPHEQLALCADALGHWSVQVVAGVRVFPNVIAAVDTDDPRQLARAVSDVTSATDDDTAALALIRAVRLIDVDLADRGDAAAAAAPDRDPVVVRGPYPTATGSGTLLLLRRPRRTVQSADRRDVVAASLRHHQLLPPLPPGLAWDARVAGDPARPVRRRLLQSSLRAAARSGLRVTLWPSTSMRMAEVRLDATCAVVDPTAAQRRAVRADLAAALTQAITSGAHILLLPELYLHANDLGHLRHALASAPETPLLTVVGLTHRATGGRWRNQAVALDFTGTEVWRYTKVNPYIESPSVTGAPYTGEYLDPGRTVVLRYSAAGWITTSICVDTFSPATATALGACQPSLSLVPSLSTSTKAHKTAAEGLRASGTVTFVANRPFVVDAKRAPSFHTREFAALDIVGPHTVTLPPGP